MAGYSRCPKCGHTPLPQDQRLPAACPACGVILAKLAAPRLPAETPALIGKPSTESAVAWQEMLLGTTPMDPVAWWLRALMLVGFGLWGIALMRMDYRSGEMGSSFVHGPLLVFHEAGHVIFRLFGEWVSVLGGTLGQLLMPAVLLAALLLKNRDPYGAAIGLWLLGVSLLDVAPYLYDALEPSLMLLSGRTGEEGGHDWIYLLSSLGWLQQAQVLGSLVHKLGAGVVLLALAWGAAVLARARPRT